MSAADEIATCRGCRRVLRGKPYWAGGFAYHPETGEQVKSNHYGGWVCSRHCDFKAALELEQTMPGHGYGQRSPGCYPPGHLDRKWGAAA